jgi:hypothetical protein
MRNLRKIDNDVSHEFDLQLFLRVRDILSDGQFNSYFLTVIFNTCKCTFGGRYAPQLCGHIPWEGGLEKVLEGQLHLAKH